MHKPLEKFTLRNRLQLNRGTCWKQRSLLKWGAIAFCLSCIAGCHREFTTTKEYVEQFEFDEKKGVVKTWKGSFKTEWK